MHIKVRATYVANFLALWDRVAFRKYLLSVVGWGEASNEYPTGYVEFKVDETQLRPTDLEMFLKLYC